jgi:hypothetical protein
VDYDLIRRCARLLVDTRNACAARGGRLPEAVIANA